MWLLGIATLVFIAGVVWPTLAAVGAVVDGLLLALVVVDARLALARPLVVHRTWPDRVHQHEPTTVALTVDNPSNTPLQVALHDGWPAALRPESAIVQATVSATHSHRWTLSLQPQQRGEHTFFDATVRVLGPLGLAWHQRSIPVQGPQHIAVLPQARLDGADGLAIQRALRRPPGALLKRHTGASHALAHLREYQRGDPQRSVHWKASARHHRPITRVTRQTEQRRVVVMIDASRPMAAATDSRSRLDRVLGAVLGFARIACRQRDAVTLVAFDLGIRRVVHIHPRAPAFGPAYQALHDLHPSDTPADYLQAASWVRQHSPRGALVLWCTTVPEPAVARELRLAVVGIGQQRPSVLLNVVDTDLTALARQIPETPLQAYEKATAMARRRRLVDLARSLESAGVAVVQAPADKIAVGLVDRYLAARARS